MGVVEKLQELFTDPEPRESFVDLMNFWRYHDFDDGIVECKHGELMAAWKYTGVDQESASADELNHLSNRLNNEVFRLMDKGWVMWVDAFRVETMDYPAPEDCHFTDPISRMIDDERRKAVLEQEHHFETAAFIVLQFQKPGRVGRAVSSSMVDESDADTSALTAEEKDDQYFRRTIQKFERTIRSVMPIERIGSYVDEDGKSYCNFARLLNMCATGINRPVQVPDPRIPLDCLIAGQDFWPGFSPMVGQNHVAVISIEGVQSVTMPTMLAAFDDLPLRYRWSTRFHFMDKTEAIESMAAQSRKWSQKVTSLKDQMTRNEKATQDLDAIDMVSDAAMAKRELTNGSINHGHYTGMFVLYDADEDQLLETAEMVRELLDQLGFGGRVETVNATEAFIGSIPGNAVDNVARDRISTANLADLLPVASSWPGERYAPCPYYEPYSPPLIQAETPGSTPFSVNIHVADAGGALIAGPRGAGKTILAALMIAQFAKYRNAQIYAFDYGYSLFTLVHGMNGRHFEIGKTAGPGESPNAYMPLRDIDTPEDRLWAGEYVEMMLELQNVSMNATRRLAVTDAIERLRHSDTRSLSEYIANLQDIELREALGFYAAGGPAGHILDGETDAAEFTNVNCFEIRELMELGDRVVLPTLLYLFRRFEKSLDGRPSLLALPEVWMMFEHPVCREKIRKYFKTTRKDNLAVIMDTQSVSDAVKSDMLDIVLENCETRILLPNPAIDGDAIKPFYQKTLQMNDREIAQLARAIPKRQYYFSSAKGRRMFELNLRPKTLAFIGKTSKADIAAARTCMAREGDHWREAWLRECGAA